MTDMPAQGPGVPAPTSEGGPLWTGYAVRLAERLRVEGGVTDPRLLDAVAQTPRHAFLLGPVLTVGDDQRWLRTAYGEDSADSGLVVPGVSITPARARTPVAALVRDLAHLLDGVPVADGGPGGAGGVGRVLVAELGDGYPAALVCRVLGSAHRDRLVCLAGEGSDPANGSVGPAGEVARVIRILARTGCYPAVVYRAENAQRRGPYSRILGGRVGEVPGRWISALGPGGRLVLRWDSPMAPMLLVLDRDRAGGTSASGRAYPDPHADPDTGADGRAGPLPGSAGRLTVSDGAPDRGGDGAVGGGGVLDPGALDAPGLRALLGLLDPTLLAPRRVADHGMTWWEVRATDGAFVEIGRRTLRAASGCSVVHGGPRRLWPVIDHAVRAWRRWGRPGPDRYGVTAHADGTHTVWLDTPGSPALDLTTSPS